MSEHFLGSNKGFEILAKLGLDPLSCRCMTFIYSDAIDINEFLCSLSDRIGRCASQQPSSNNHFCTTHFMNTLKREVPVATASWTRTKDKNVFQKKLVFVPVNVTLHLSLCVVINPGLIVKHLDCGSASKEEYALQVLQLCLDKLLLHQSLHSHIFSVAFCFRMRR
jgi:Ulp1 family protease